MGWDGTKKVSHGQACRYDNYPPDLQDSDLFVCAKLRATVTVSARTTFGGHEFNFSGCIEECDFNLKLLVNTTEQRK